MLTVVHQGTLESVFLVASILVAHDEVGVGLAISMGVEEENNALVLWGRERRRKHDIIANPAPTVELTPSQAGKWKCKSIKSRVELL